MIYTTEEILKRCPEKWKNKIIYEWNIKESDSKRYYLIEFLLVFDLLTLEETQDQFVKTKESPLLKGFLISLYKTNYEYFHNLFKLIKIEFDENYIDLNLIDLLLIFIKQNDILKFCIWIKTNSDAKLKKEKKSKLDILDTLISINELGITRKLKLHNYKRILTYRQLNLFLEKAQNKENKQLLNLYNAVVHGVSLVMGGKDSKPVDLKKVLFEENENEYVNEYQIAREEWFKEKKFDKSFVLEKCVKLDIATNKFFPENEIPEEYKYLNE